MGRATRERGRPARMHYRSVPLRFLGMGHPSTLPARTAWARTRQSPGRRRPPGARASRPHALPQRAAQIPWDGAPVRPAGENRMGSDQAESWEEAPTRERGRPARMHYRSVSLRFPVMGHGPRRRREPHGPDRSRALASLPVEPGRGDGRGCARMCAGGTPALPGGLHSIDGVAPKRKVDSSSNPT